MKGAMRGAVVAIVGMVLVFPMAAVVLSQVKEVKGAEERSRCLNNIRQVCFAMIQYAGDYDDEYPSALDPKAGDKEPTQYRFAKLLKLVYMNHPKVFHCPAAGKGTVGDAPIRGLEQMKEAQIAQLCLGERDCSYGLDPNLRHNRSASRAMIADRPHHDYWGTGMSSPGAGKEGSNSENHGGEGQNVAYNDGHVKWAGVCADDAGVDPNIYGVNPEINALDDSNIDFGVKAEKKGE